MRKGRFGRAQKFEIAADPLFEVGSEHILFLVDITGDGVHSKGRQLYRVVNPMGRYEIKPGGLLHAPAKDKHLDGVSRSRLPQSEKDLRRQIAVALAKADSTNPHIQ